MNCPSCARSELIHVDLGERDFIGVDRCPSCNGCWLDVHELNRLHSDVWSSVEDLRLTTAEALSGVICPKCSVQMVTLNPDDHSELAVERCPSCHGLWLDSGELSALHEIAAQHVAEHGTLQHRPDDWSMVRWLAYRVAEEWKHIREG